MNPGLSEFAPPYSKAHIDFLETDAYIKVGAVQARPRLESTLVSKFQT